ncbi:cytochrome P450 [Streptomyces kasugaensis]|uniref:Cytochrome P450 n=1 Tax=Streptomyces kasugaensis TaxID=1946 RepID=A0A4Q9HY52_STRKA|nr:cytochrome P450 [Streptomyces kasugaensis]TBO59250.1 cytochrome P450 [Streptomyces kasugaensis]
MRIGLGEPDHPVPLDSIELFDPAAYLRGSQHGAWHTLRRQAPVRRERTPDGTDYWSFVSYADCDRIIKDTATFGSEHGTILASVGVGDSAGGMAITLMDPPDHGQIRQPSMRRLRHAVVRNRTDDISARVLALAAPLLTGGEHDVARLLRTLPMAAAGDLMGIPEEYWDTVAFNTTASIAPQDPEYAVGRNVEDTLRRVHHKLFAVFSEIIRSRRRNLGEDLISGLLTLEYHGRRMPEQQVLMNCYSFALGANSTTPHVAAQLLLTLAEQPELWEAVLADPSLVPALVDEGTRWVSPTHHLVRRVSKDTTLGGADLAEGDWVCAWVASANRDENVFRDPYTFDLTRSPNPHMGFGVGPHYCIGAPASKVALAALFGELARRRIRFELAGEPTHLYSNWINGITRLPMNFTTGA